jgi:hypothetical protein
MFKSVEYAGFEGRPELRALAERTTAVLADEIRTWRDQVSVVWGPGQGAQPPINLTMRLTFPDVTVSTRWAFHTSDFTNEDSLRVRCRRAWRTLLDRLTEYDSKRFDALSRLPVEV